MPRTKEIVSEAKIENLASNIRKWRRWLSMTQADLGKKIGVTQQRIAMFEKGDAIPDIFQMQSIASVLNTTIRTLLNPTREETMNSQATREETMNSQATREETMNSQATREETMNSQATREETMNSQATREETMNILASMQAREQLLESLNLRVETSPHIQKWIGNLEEQQLSDIDSYKDHFLLSGQSRQETTDSPEPVFQETTDSPEPVFNERDNWGEQFAEGFISYLNDENSSLLDSWLGRRYSYPTYIGFDIRKSEGEFNFFGSDAYWLATNLREKQVFAGIHFRDPLYYQQLEAQKSHIDFEFSQEFGRTLEWRSTTGNAGIYRISVLVGVDHNHSQNLLFEYLRKTLEKLETVFKDRLDTISQRLRPYSS